MQRFFQCQRGATAIEYGLIAGVIVIIMLVGLTLLGNKTGSHYNYVADQVTKSMK